MAIISKARKLKFQSSLQLNFPNIQVTNISGFLFNFVGCESFFKSSNPDDLTLCDKTLEDSVESGNVSMRGYLHLIRRGPVTYMHDLAALV